MQKIRKAIIPAAGMGTRFLPATKAQPKEMLPIVDKPTIQYIVEEAINSGIEDIIIVTGRGKRAIEDHFDKSFELEATLEAKANLDLLGIVQDIAKLVDLHYIRQKEPRGLGDAIYCARKFIGNEPFAVLLGDDIICSEKPVLKQLIDIYDSYPGTILGVQEVPFEHVKRYGIVKPKGEKNGSSLTAVADLVEKPSQEVAPSNLAILGRYIISPRIFSLLERVDPGAGGEIQLTDALRMLVQSEPMYAYTFAGKRYDVGDKLGFLQATVEFALGRDDLQGPFKKYLKNIAEKLD